MPELRVVDTSPFIVLAQGGWIELLLPPGGSVIVPRIVADEISRAPVADAAVEALRTLPWLHIAEEEAVPSEVRRFGLDAGEEAVLAWTLGHSGSVAIIDELRGRRAATALSLRVTGTLGLVLGAKESGVIPAARPVIEHLLNVSDWFMAADLLELELTRVGE